MLERRSHDFRIAIFGVGQLGSRYLQGLVGAVLASDVFVCDPYRSSLERASARLAEVAGHERIGVTYSSASSEAPDEIDLSIVATTADVRKAVVADVGRRSRVKYWLLEKVLAQSAGDIDQIVESTTAAKDAWVNTARRAMPWYQEIVERLKGCGPYSVEKRGAQWGLACNGIHFIDLVQWLTGAALTGVDATGIEEWVPSKRPGFFEARGQLRADYSDGSTLLLRDSDEYQNDNMIRIRCAGDEIDIDEQNGTATSDRGLEIKGRIVFQSELTGRVVDNILESGACLLPKLSLSAELHKPYLSAIAASWSLLTATTHAEEGRAPIT